MLIIKEDKNTFVIDEYNTIHFIYEDDEEKRRGHATVIYGYYYYGSTQYMEMWNPGSGTVQQVIYYLDGKVGYLYNNEFGRN